MIGLLTQFQLHRLQVKIDRVEFKAAEDAAKLTKLHQAEAKAYKTNCAAAVLNATQAESRAKELVIENARLKQALLSYEKKASSHMFLDEQPMCFVLTHPLSVLTGGPSQVEASPAHA